MRHQLPNYYGKQWMPLIHSERNPVEDPQGCKDDSVTLSHPTRSHPDRIPPQSISPEIRMSSDYERFLPSTGRYHTRQDPTSDYLKRRDLTPYHLKGQHPNPHPGPKIPNLIAKTFSFLGDLIRLCIIRQNQKLSQWINGMY